MSSLLQLILGGFFFFFSERFHHLSGLSHVWLVMPAFTVGVASPAYVLLCGALSWMMCHSGHPLLLGPVRMLQKAHFAEKMRLLQRTWSDPLCFWGLTLFELLGLDHAIRLQ